MNRVLFSSLSDFASSLSRSAEFPAFPDKLGIVVRFRDGKDLTPRISGLVCDIAVEWPSLCSTTRGEIVLCSDAQEKTTVATKELEVRCRALAAELLAHADRLKARGSRLQGLGDSDPLAWAESLESLDSAKRDTLSTACHEKARSTTHRENATLDTKPAKRAQGSERPDFAKMAELFDECKNDKDDFLS